MLVLARSPFVNFLTCVGFQVILVEPWFSWLEAWNERFADLSDTPLCKVFLRMHSRNSMRLQRSVDVALLVPV